MGEFKYKGREDEYHKEYGKDWNKKNKAKRAKKSKEYRKNNPWIFEKQYARTKLINGKISQEEYSREIEEIDKRRGVKTKPVTSKDIVEQLKMKIKELESKNENLRIAYDFVIVNLEKKKIALKKARKEPGAWKTNNKLQDQLCSHFDKLDIDDIVNSRNVSGIKQTPVISKLKQRMDEMALENERLNK